MNSSLKEARQHVHNVVTKARTSFYWAMRTLSKPKREAIFAVYAFCREVDDIADSEEDVGVKQEKLERWRQEIKAVFDGQPEFPTARMLPQAVASYDLQESAFLAIIDGMETDAQGSLRAPSMAELELYCSRVACAVGFLCIRIFGEPGESGKATANHLGLALQFTNILRDLKEDADMGRLYLPSELLRAQGIVSEDPNEILSDSRLPAVCMTLAKRAREEFDMARVAMQACDRSHVRPVRIMMEVYNRTLDRLISGGFRNNIRRNERSFLVRVWEKTEKLLIAIRYAIF